MEDDELTIMKKRIIQSYKWENEVIVPTAREFGISKEEMAQFYMNNLDMSYLESLFGLLETSKELEIAYRLHADLRITFFCECLHLIDKETVEELKTELAREVMDGKSYDDVLKEGRYRLFLLMKECLEWGK